MSKRSVVLAVVGDPHPGSTVAICPPEGVRLDDGGTYRPSKPQQWLWWCWTDYWKKAEAKRKQLGASLWVVLNGDLGEGDHHGTSQIISKNPEAQDYVANRVFGVVTKLSPERLFVVRGTEAHTGDSGSFEEGLARRLNAERDPETKNWSRWHLRLDVNGVLCDFQHHGRAGQRPWTEASIAQLLAFQIYVEHVRRGLRHPDLAFRSHTHKKYDSHDAHPTRVIGVPSFQLKTAYAHKRATESIADVGGWVTTVSKAGEAIPSPILYLPALPKVA